MSGVFLSHVLSFLLSWSHTDLGGHGLARLSVEKAPAILWNPPPPNARVTVACPWVLVVPSPVLGLQLQGSGIEVQVFRLAE